MQFENLHGYFPSVNTKLQGVTHPLSWRVAILPFLGQQELYNKYRLDEPWNSKHNLTLLKLMPDAYRHPSQTGNQNQTNYVTIAGALTGTGDGSKPIRFEDFAADPISTLLVTESIGTIRGPNRKTQSSDKINHFPYWAGSTQKVFMP